MAYNLIPADRGQVFLMPPSIDEWLSADHPARVLVELIDDLDLSAFYEGRREDGWGRASYDPAVMVGILLYGYITGVRSARAIERCLQENVAFRFVAANNIPDHATIARFRTSYAIALEGLFTQVLGVCVRAELIDTSVVALDGTKMEANASSRKTVTEKELEDMAHEILEDARRIDEEEDEAYGDASGWRLPERLKDPDERKRLIREELEKIKAARAKTWEGRQRTARVNTTDPESRTMIGKDGYLQGYNAQAVVDKNRFVLAGDVSNSAADNPLFQAMVTAAADNLAGAGGGAIGTVLADAGYLSSTNLETPAAQEAIIAPAHVTRINDTEIFDEAAYEEQKRRYRAAREEIDRETDRRCEVLDRLMTGKLLLREAAAELGMSVPGVWQLKRRYEEQGRDGARPRVSLRPPPGPTARQIMAAKLRDEATRDLYKLRSVIVEPLFAQTKWVRGFERFTMRGLRRCSLEWSLMMTTHNIRQLMAATAARTPAPSLVSQF
ncbi:MAG TPA: transposase [Actinomycetota bacterium]|nr:transposase [Actinomycetota bacterium]